MVARRWSLAAAALPTRRLPTAQHARARPITKLGQNLGLCSTIAHGTPRVRTPSACFLNLVSLVRFQPGAPLSACTGRFREVRTRTNPLQVAVGADIRPTSTPPNYKVERSGGSASKTTTPK